MNGRDLLVVFLLLVTAGLAWRGRGPPPLGPPHPEPKCARPVEIIGEGVSCDGRGDRGRVGRMPPARLQAFAAPVDLNRATAAELASLEGIGPKLALRILAARPFAAVEDLLRVRGIGARRLARLRPRLMVVTSGTRANVLLDE
jgi:competence ComEA-like helix-hairpin-helix protein